MMKTKNFFQMLVAVVVSELAGVVGSFATTPAISGWYATLEKPFLNPPNWVFGPVWTILFALMGISLFLVWKNYPLMRDDKKSVVVWRISIAAFFSQLIFNTLWSFIFFGFRNPGGAFIEIIFLWLLIIVTIILFSKVSKLAAWLLIPYVIWVSFAGYLNYSIWQLNKNLPDQGYFASLPNGYTSDSYTIEKISEISCIRSEDCLTPAEYLVQSRCPFQSLCLKNKCTVVCPVYSGSD